MNMTDREFTARQIALEAAVRIRLTGYDTASITARPMIDYPRNVLDAARAYYAFLMNAEPADDQVRANA